MNRAVAVGHPKTALEFLTRNRPHYEKYSSVEELIWDLDEPGGEHLNGVVHHLSVLRRQLADVLWGNEIFVGASVLDELLFSSLHDPTCSDPVTAVIAFVCDRGLHRPGFIVYPIHGLGLHGFGFLGVVFKARIVLEVEGADAVVLPQANTFSRAYSNIDEARGLLGVRAKLPKDLLEHWYRSRPLEWLHSNPLAVYSMRSRPGSYYENQAFVLLRLRYLATLLFMLTVLEQHDNDRIGAALSTSRLNNFETFDFKHYLAFYPKGGVRPTLTGDCVPLPHRGPNSIEATDLPIEINPKRWRRRSQLCIQVVSLVRSMERRYLHYYLFSGVGGSKTRIARKVFDSFHYFRRSFRVDGYPGEMAVALATAFEVLLTDNYSRGVDGVIQTHLRLALRGVTGSRRMRAAVAQLYEARSQVVHGGRTTIDIDYAQARLAYVHAAIRINEIWARIPDNSADPIAQALRI